MKDFSQRVLKLDRMVVKDGFNIPLAKRIMQNQGSYLMKTATGFYRESYMVLTNRELYLYNDKDHSGTEQLICLTPGVFVKSLNCINVEQNQGPIHGKVYPIEIFVGGQLGNIGIDGVKLAKDKSSGLITLFFDKPDDHQKWMKFLEKATGSYSIKEHYSFSENYEKKLQSILTAERLTEMKKDYKD